MRFYRTGFTTGFVTGVATACVVAGAGCGGGDTGTGDSMAADMAADTASGAAAPAPSMGTSPANGTSSMVTAGSGAKNPASGTNSKPASNTKNPAATTMTNTMGAAGHTGGAGGAAMSTAGTMAAASMVDAGAAGSGDMGAAGGGDMMAGTGEAFAIRGDDPTDESANGRNKGPYSVESYTSGYKPGNFTDATMWYPSSPDAEPPFGCVAVVPGFVSPQASIRNWGPFLASNGIVAITIGVPGSDVPQQRAMSLMSALETCKGENSRDDSPIKGKLAEDVLGVAGWSMGGGGTLIAAAGNPMLKAAVSFAAWGPSGGAMDKVPVLMFEATADPLAASMSDGYYQAVPDGVPKMLFEVQGAGHDVANDPANSQGIIGKYGLSWFKVFLEGDMRYKKFLTASPPSITTMKFATNVK